MTEIRKTEPFKILLGTAALFFIIACLKITAGFLVPIIISLFISSVCLSIAFWLKKRKVNYILAVAISFTLLFFTIFLLVSMLSAGIQGFLANINEYKMLLNLRLAEVRESLNILAASYDVSPAEIFDINRYFYLFANWASSVGKAFTNIGIILVITLFAVFEGINLSTKFSAAFPNYAFTHIREIIKMVNDYLLVKTLINITSGAVVAITLIIFGVKHAVLFGFLVFLLNYIPAIGIILAAILPILLTWVQYGAGLNLALMISLYTSVHLSLSVLEPKITGDKFGLSGLVVMLSLIFWSWLFGPVGMFLAVPLTMIIKIIAETNQKSKWLAVIMS